MTPPKTAKKKTAEEHFQKKAEAVREAQEEARNSEGGPRAGGEDEPEPEKASPPPLNKMLQSKLAADEDTTDKEKLAFIDEFLRRNGDQPFLSSRLRGILWGRGLLPDAIDYSDE